MIVYIHCTNLSKNAMASQYPDLELRLVVLDQIRASLVLIEAGGAWFAVTPQNGTNARE